MNATVIYRIHLRLLVPLIIFSLCLTKFVRAEENVAQNYFSQNRTVYFPQFEMFQTIKNETDMLYEMTGKLILKDECLRVVAGKNEFLLIWPGWYELSAAGREITVKRLKTGVVIAQLKLGDTVRFTGAEIENNPINLKYAIPNQCTAPYWAVGEIETVQNPSPVVKSSKQARKEVDKVSTNARKSILKYTIGQDKNTGANKGSSKELIDLEIKLEDSLVK